MDKPEFYELNHDLSNQIRRYLLSEHEFMAHENFYKSDQNKRFRTYAASTVARHWRYFCYDTFIAYLAVNYFDRFMSTRDLTPEVMEGRSITEEIGLVAFACLTISANFRKKNFSVDKYLNFNKKISEPATVKKMISNIWNRLGLGVNWQVKSVTAFTFLDYYFPYFKNIGIFQRRWIYEILVQAQGDHTFVNYRPSLMAFSAFIAASTILYPSKDNEVANALTNSEILSKELVQECANLMVELCSKKNINFEPPKSKIDLTSSKVGRFVKNAKSKVGKSSKLETVAEEVEELSDSDEKDAAKGVIEAEAQRLAKAKGKEDDITESKVETVPEEVAELSEEDVAREITEEEKRRLAKGKGKAVDMTKTSDDKARAEALTPPALKKDKEDVEDDAQPRNPVKAHMEFLEHVAPNAVNMNFELKWPIPEGERAQPKCFSYGSCTIV